MMNLANVSLDRLVNGRDGTGIGRDEAAEIARRYGDAIGNTCVAQKWGGQWYVVPRYNSVLGCKRLPISAAVDDLFDMR